MSPATSPLMPHADEHAVPPRVEHGRRPVVVDVNTVLGNSASNPPPAPTMQPTPAIPGTSTPTPPTAPARATVIPDAPHHSTKPSSGFSEAVREGRPFGALHHPALEREDPVLRVRDFSLYYGQARALWDINMIFPRGKVAALIGPSGCGKSTLLRSINRLNDLIDSVRCTGDMILNGQPVYAPNVDVIDTRKRIGMVFQKSNPFPMSIFENVVYSLRIDGERRKSVLNETCERALRAAALWDEVKDRLHQSALGMSGGQQQRLCIARAIAAEPEVLLMDEPCSALDPIATLKVEEFIREIAGRITVVIVTHNMQQAARVSHYTAFMYLGRLVEYGRTSDIFQNPLVQETENYVTGRFG